MGIGSGPVLTSASAEFRQGQKEGAGYEESCFIVGSGGRSGVIVRDGRRYGNQGPAGSAAPAPSPWDVAITAALMTDYNFRGITQSAHNPSSQAGFELRYTQSPMLQYYAGISGESIDFPNHAAAEIDFYGGFRPTFDKLALDFGFWYY